MASGFGFVGSKAGHGGLTRAGMDVAATLGQPVSEETKHISSQAWAIAAHCCPGKNGLKREWLSPGNANSSHEEFSGCAALASQMDSRVGESTSITRIIPRWQCLAEVDNGSGHLSRQAHLQVFSGQI